MQRMLPRTLTLSAVVGLLAAGGALAAPGMGGGGMGGGMGGMGGGGMGGGTNVPGAGAGGVSTTTSATASRIPPHTAAASGLKAGMSVKDSAGVAVGKITKVGVSGGAPAVLIDVDGKSVVVMGSTLSVSGDSATSSQTKDEIAASPEPKPS